MFSEAEKASFLLGVNCQDMLKAFLTPKVKVGSEYVTKGQNLDQVMFAVHALSKCLYAKAFAWLVERVNKTLDTKAKRQYYIGVLDIAGFEIFEVRACASACAHRLVRCTRMEFYAPLGVHAVSLICKAPVLNWFGLARLLYAN